MIINVTVFTCKLTVAIWFTEHLIMVYSSLSMRIAYYADGANSFYGFMGTYRRNGHVRFQTFVNNICLPSLESCVPVITMALHLVCQNTPTIGLIYTAVSLTDHDFL